MTTNPDAYAAFLARKALTAPVVGFEPPPMPEYLFDFQKDIVRWAIRRGRACLFEATGLGKTRQQLAWADAVAAHTGLPVLILVPLAVAAQTEWEGRAVDVDVMHIREPHQVGQARILVTNYDRFERFDVSVFGGIVIDESSSLKAHSGAFRNLVISRAQSLPFRLACTATPAPNDVEELGNHSEFLGVMRRTEMLSTFFNHDGGDTGRWMLRGHARRAFWRWVAEWAALVRSPADLGYDGSAYDLPELRIHSQVLPADVSHAREAGTLFVEAAKTLADQRKARRSTLSARVQAAAAVANASDDHVVVWCELNDESAALTKAIAGAVEVKGSDSTEHKESVASWFQGATCRCGKPIHQATGSSDTTATPNTESASTTTPRRDTRLGTSTSTSSICGSTSASTPRDPRSLPSEPPSETSISPSGESNTPLTKTSGRRSAKRRSGGQTLTQESASPSTFESSASPSLTTNDSSPNRGEDAPSAVASTEVREATDSTLTTATGPAVCEGSSADPATSPSASSPTVPNDSSAQRCTCGRPLAGKRVLVTKGSIFGWGLNFQACHRMIFVGVTHSYEMWHQTIRRCWRFGQTQPVDVHVITSELEGAIVANLRRKEQEAEAMGEEMSQYTRDVVRENVKGADRQSVSYVARAAVELPPWLRTETAGAA